MADQLTTLAVVKARLFQAGPTDTVDDTLLGLLIDEVSDWVQGYTGRKLVPETAATYTFDTAAGYVLRIPRGIRTVTSMGVAQTHQPDTGGTYVAIPAADRLLRPKAADRPEGSPAVEVWISRGTLAGTVSSFASVANGATITGDFGYAAVPPAIEAVAVDAVVAAYTVRRQGASGVVGADDQAVVPWSKFFSRGSPQLRTLDRFRVPGIA